MALLGSRKRSPRAAELGRGIFVDARRPLKSLARLKLGERGRTQAVADALGSRDQPRRIGALFSRDEIKGLPRRSEIRQTHFPPSFKMRL